jgi:undecaprenyl diphosphate synthase
MLSHIGIIPDGNRRFAQKIGTDLFEAYNAGFKKAEDVFDWVLEVPTITRATVYALSTENFKRRTEDELKILTELFNYYFRKLADDKKIHNSQVRVRIIGDTTAVPALASSVEYLESQTKDYSKFNLNITLNYGGRKEILNAIKKIESSGMDPSTLTEEQFNRLLLEPNNLDLLVRTGGMHRLSNFLSWQSAYSELYFTETLWPELKKKEFESAVDFYNKSTKNFGK